MQNSARSNDSRPPLHSSNIEDLFNHQDKYEFEPKLNPGWNHTVMFQLPLNDDVPRPYRKSPLVWDSHHVRLPFSNESKFMEIDETGRRSTKNRWDLIEESLLQPISNSRELEQAIKKYNNRYEDIWNFVALHHLFDNCLPPQEVISFFQNLLPCIIDIALQLPHLIQCPIPLLKKQMNHSISLSQQQVVSLLANAFLCTFPCRNTDKKDSEYSTYPKINFCKLFSSTGHNIIEKLKCILNYFHRVLSGEIKKNIITFQRRSIDKKCFWQSSEIKFSKTKFSIAAIGRIENAEGMLQVDFANRFIGGGVIGHGCVQEEIRFVINPEMIVARLFTQALDNEEALIMIGCEQFNSYQGYASTFMWSGDFNDTTPLDNYRRRKCHVVAIDALFYNSFDNQFKQATINRELNKAFVGFSIDNNQDKMPVASGLWGCGAFNGHPIRSALIQFMACAVAGRNLAFYTCEDVQLKHEIEDIFNFLVKENVSVGQLFNILKTFHPIDPNQLVPYIKNEFISMILSKPESKIKLKPIKTQSVMNFFNRITTKKSESCDMPSTSAAVADQMEFKEPSVIERDKQDFEEIANTFAGVVKSTKNDETPKIKKTLLECLESDFK